MNQALINLTKKSIENCEGNRETLRAKINRLEIEVRDAERELFRVANVKQSLEAALERLEEAVEEEKGRDPTKKEMEFIKKQNLLTPSEDPQEPKEDQPAKETVEISHPIEISEEAILTDEEKDQATLEKADRLIAAGKKAMKEEKKGWKKCPRCSKSKIAPWNKKGICSPCQLKRKQKADL